MLKFSFIYLATLTILGSVNAAVREKLPNEITPISAEQSRTRDNNEVSYGAHRGIDGNQVTAAYISKASDPAAWYKVKFDGLKCIDQVKWFWGSTGTTVLTWDCDESGCGKCTGHSKCDDGSLTATVSTEGSTVYNQPHGCKHGDQFELKNNGDMWMFEIAFTGTELTTVREKLPNEITPISAEQSRTRDNNEVSYGAHRGIDGNQVTAAYISKAFDPVAWYKVKFDGLKCIDQVKWFWGSTGTTVLTWDCDKSGCGKCTGHSKCDDGSLTVMVSIEGATDYTLPSISSGCAYGNTFKLQNNGDTWVFEIAFSGKVIDENTSTWITAKHNIPAEFSTGCNLKVLTAGTSESKTNWNGDIKFSDGNQDLLYIGLHPKRQRLAVKNDVFERGIMVPMRDFRWVEATYPEADDEGNREYIFYFTESGFGIKCANMTLIFIPYDELTNDIEEFVNGINSVKFGLRYSPAKGPILLQYAKECPGHLKPAGQ